ncbi:transposase [Candidatus Poribacteria bacterium]|nr:transposase [Candidatus Poribacteria bacterium]
MFATSVVPTVYSLRWQIELVFKSIKSHLGFEFILGKREARIECQLYGRLIGMVLSLFLTGQFRQQLWKSNTIGQLLSENSNTRNDE